MGRTPYGGASRAMGVPQPCPRTPGTQGRSISKFHTNATVYFRLLVAGTGHADYHQGGHSATDINLDCRTADLPVALRIPFCGR